jgi:chemotaxis protein CheX
VSAMETPLTSAEIAALIRVTTQRTFSTMLGISLTAGPETGGPTRDAPEDGVLSFVGFAGDWSGTGVIRCSSSLACIISSRMLMTEYASVNDDVLDVIGEITNMIIGNFKDEAAHKLGPLGLSIPTVVYGKNFQAHNANHLSWTAVPFDYQGELFEVKVSIVASRQQRAVPLAVGGPQAEEILCGDRTGA